MRATCLDNTQQRTACLTLQIVLQSLKHQMVGNAPLTQPTLQREVFVRHNVRETHSCQISTHIREVRVAPVIIFQSISMPIQRACNRRKMIDLPRIFHQTGCRLSRIATQYRHNATVGTEAVGIEMLKENAFFGPSVHVWHSTGLHQLTREALQYHDINIGPLHGEQSFCAVAPRVEQRPADALRLTLVHKPILRSEVLLLRQALHQAEHRVHGRMIQPHVLTEIGLAHIHHRHAHTTSDGQKQRPRQHKLQHRPSYPSTTVWGKTVKPVFHLLHQQENARRQEQRHCTAHYHRPHAHTRHGISRRREKVEQRRNIKRKAPIAIKHEVETGRHGKQQCGQRVIATANPSRDTPTTPRFSQYQQPRHHAEIACHRKVERQSVKHHLPYVAHPCRRHQRMMPKHETRFLQGKEHHPCRIDREKLQCIGFHQLIGMPIPFVNDAKVRKKGGHHLSSRPTFRHINVYRQQ